MTLGKVRAWLRDWYSRNHKEPRIVQRKVPSLAQAIEKRVRKRLTPSWEQDPPQKAN